ncbi:Alpha/Beta hydrolase protein [Trichoderma velutinum]
MTLIPPAEPKTNISSEFPFELHAIDVLNGKITYVDTGSPVHDHTSLTHIFIHGNPTSSYVWRNIIPHIMPKARCIALDLIVVPAGKVILVTHDWGSALGFDWAFNNKDRIAGLFFFEFAFRSFRVEQTGRELLIEENAFINKVLVDGIARSLSDTEMDYYSRPYLQQSDREPLYRWPNEVPIEGIPVDWYMKSLRNAKGIFAGKGYHFLQEDHPHRIGTEILDWSQKIQYNSSL